jgi:hypothetical protein
MDPAFECIVLIERFIGGEISIHEFERAYLSASQGLPLLPDELSEPLERVFYAVETYDSTKTPETETTFNISEETMRQVVQGAWDEINRLPIEIRSPQ